MPPLTDIPPETVPGEPQALPPEPLASLEPAPEATVLQPAPEPPSKSKRNQYLIIGIAIAGVCVMTLLCVALAVRGVAGFGSDRTAMQQLIDQFMRDMAKKDAESAIALFSSHARSQMEISTLEKLLQGNNFVLFDGYQSDTVDSINYTAAFNTNPKLPQGKVANIRGTVHYAGGIQGVYQAVLEQDGGEWRLFGINITVPPDKFSP